MGSVKVLWSKFPPISQFGYPDPDDIIRTAHSFGITVIDMINLLGEEAVYLLSRFQSWLNELKKIGSVSEFMAAMNLIL